ncbi:MAG: electron transfer flavoprotein subunit beta/FixA family protein [Deltaproteobacteria bacterium]|nr:electron transfer flavoprotein subunit beta/FixA family protein [Deltaproteobacteria bacterium]
MNIIVCIKRVPMTQEVDLEIDELHKGVKKDALAYVINDWDNYAIEEAVLLQEKFGGNVTAITIGDEEDEEVLRRALAMGADKSIRIDPGERELDGFVIAKILATVINDLEYDLVLTGVQADDDNSGMVGIMLAEALGLSHAAVVTGVQPEGDEASIRVELEGGTDEIAKIKLPALLTVQTGINEPRYVSIMGIRKARKKELAVIDVAALGLSEDDLIPRTVIEEVFLPPETAGAEMIEGDPSSVADELIKIIKEKGVSL